MSTDFEEKLWSYEAAKVWFCSSSRVVFEAQMVSMPNIFWLLVFETGNYLPPQFLDFVYIYGYLLNGKLLKRGKFLRRTKFLFCFRHGIGLLPSGFC